MVIKVIDVKKDLNQYEIDPDTNTPIVTVVPRKDFPRGWEFYCVYCKTKHHHGEGLGHRVAHCTNQKSPFLIRGYVLKEARQC